MINKHFKKGAAWLLLVAMLALVPAAAFAEEETTTGTEATETTEATESTETTEATEETTEAAASTEETAAVARVTIGADLTDAQRASIYAYFGIEEGSVPELSVNNTEERAYLEGLVSDKKIGNVTLSCVYLTILPEGSGLDITINNINYCTEQMYINALNTAGITDARIVISAPYAVSGTGALTGIYKAYEDITGTSLSDIAKQIGAEELVVTGELAEFIGSDQAAELIAQLKQILDQTQGMTDDEVRTEIKNLCATYNISLTDDQIEQVLSLVRRLEGLDESELQTTLTNIANAAQTANTVKEKASEILESVKGFFAKVGAFFTGLFGGSSNN